MNATLLDADTVHCVALCSTLIFYPSAVEGDCVVWPAPGVTSSAPLRRNMGWLFSKPAPPPPDEPSEKDKFQLKLKVSRDRLEKYIAKVRQQAKRLCNATTPPPALPGRLTKSWQFSMLKRGNC